MGIGHSTMFITFKKTDDSPEKVANKIATSVQKKT